MDKRTFGVIAVAAGLALGLMGNILFYGRLVGLSFPIYIALAVIILLALTRPAQVKIQPRNLWPLLPLGFFAVMVAIRADELVTLLNIGAVLALGALVVYYLPLARSLDEETLGKQTQAVLEVGIMLVPVALLQTVEAWGWLREKRHQRGGVFAAVVRGSVFALPIVLVFAFLLGSADAVFAKYVSEAFDSVWKALGIKFLDDTLGRWLLTGGLATVATGALGFSLMRNVAAPPATPETEQASSDPEMEMAAAISAQTKEKAKPAFKLGMVESGIIMGSVVALFAAFVVIQFRYFFGGRTTIEVAGLTFAQYARRGFFELVAVSVLTLGLSLWLDKVSVRQSKRENHIFRGLALAIVALTSIMLVSAAQRMWLYEEAFGFTQLRVYTHVFMVWLGVMFAVFVVAMFRLKTNIFSLGTLLVIIGYLATINLMNIDHYIAERNIARYHAGQELDIAFLNILSADAVPEILPLWQSATDDQVKEWSGQWLARQLLTLDKEMQGGSSLPFSLNTSRLNAWNQLDHVRRELPAYDPSLYWGSYYDSYGSGRSDYESGWETLGTDVPGSR
ncbi:MAG: DUF4173 domain-containing protein [Anaerolineae bacterium]